MKKFLYFFLLLMTTSASASPRSFDVTEGRTMLLTGAIDQRSPLFASAIVALTLADRTRPIDLVIDSDGGFVEGGYMIVSAIEYARKAGVIVRCIDVNHAYSMGFMIFMHCSNRYMLPSASAMFHYPRAAMPPGAYTAPQFETEAKALRQGEAMFLDDLSRHLNADKPSIDRQARNETMWNASSINKFAPGFTQVVDRIQGVKVDTLFTRTAPTH